MNWSWHFANASGEPVAQEAAVQPAKGFPTQGDAETWVGEVWRDLLAAGVDQVSLYEEGRLSYGPMSLHPES